MYLRRYQFGDWLIEPELNRISSEEVERHLEPLTMDVLCHLLEHVGDIVSSKNMLAAVWNGKVVESNAVPRAINQIRVALDDDPRSPRYIETIRKRGYRTIADVRELDPEPAMEVGPKPRGTLWSGRRRWWLGLAAVTAVVGVAVVSLRISVHPTYPASERSIVVIPFTNLSPNPSDAYLTDGISEELILALEAIPGLAVASRTASFFFQRQPADLVTIGEQLGVRYALEGSVRRSGDTVRVAARLVRIEDDATLFSDEFDREMEDLIDLQSELALVIVNALSINLSESAVRSLSAAGTQSETAFDLLLRAMDHYRKDNALDLKKADTLARAAIQEDPSFMRAYRALGAILAQSAARTGEFQRYHQQGIELERQIDALFPGGTRPDDHFSLTRLYLLKRDWPSAEKLLAHHLRNDDNNYLPYQLYAYLLANAGLFDAALSYSRTASKLAPFEPRPIEQVGDMLRQLGHHEEALAAFRRCHTIAPERTGCFNEIGWTLLVMGRVEDARHHFGDKVSRLELCIAAWSDDCAFYPDSPYPTFVGYAVAVAGNLDEAFRWFDRAVTVHDGFIHQIRWQRPDSVPLETDPRYEQLLERLGLHDAWQKELCQRARDLTGVTGIPVACS